ncbi:RES family NAD+ phosphorylase [Novosphingobium gossypii]|uniref:RES family NAD+ phosphorylase n=1 Tax=Novosphingobium gossypii TaxID=1604774 RepID=UPI003D1C9DE7
MVLDEKTLASLTRRAAPSAFLRCTPIAYRATPLGMGCGKTRFACPADGFKLLYIAQDLPTAIADAIVRDRFEGVMPREMLRSDFAGWGVCEVDAAMPLRVLDLRRDGCFKLGVSTDIVGAKAQLAARRFSQTVHEHTDLDGILYFSRLLRRECLAIYERAVPNHLTASNVVELETLARLIPALQKLRIRLIAAMPRA